MVYNTWALGVSIIALFRWLDGARQKENKTENTYRSSSHSKWDCKYHVVFVSKYHRQAFYWEIRKRLGSILFAGEHFWARGYAGSAFGFNEDKVRSYIRSQKDSNGSGGF